ncbi:MAG: ABC transporter substrate binding protein [Candidatus Zixiibacteriota bacterium]
MKRLLVNLLALSFLLFGGVDARTVRIGFLQAGDHIMHSGIRTAFGESLTRLVPDSVHIEFSPKAVRSADWNRDSCRSMAAQLSKMTDVDIFLTVGPWAPEELLAAGCKKPIVSLYRVDPRLEGLADTLGVPNAPNLTVTIPDHRIEADLTLLSQIVPIKRLGYLYFPAADEAPKIKQLMDSIGRSLGFDVVTADGMNTLGVFAFFKAYNSLDHKIDALYLMPTWGLDAQRTRDFLERVLGDKIPVLSYEGRMAVERGALASDAGNDVNAQAWFGAWKAAQIIAGKSPASLPTLMPQQGGLIISEGAAHVLGKQFPEEIWSQSDVVWPLALPSWQQLTMAGAVKRAFDQNPGYLAAFDALNRAGAEASRAWAQLFPSIVADGSFLHESDNAVNNSHEWDKPDQTSIGLTLQQSIFSLPAIRAIQLAAKTRQSALIDIDKARLELEYGVSIAYLNYVKALMVLGAQNNYRQFVDYSLALARTKFQVGSATEAEVNRWAAERLKCSGQVYEARSNVRVARILVNALLNQPWDDRFTVDTLPYTAGNFLMAYQKIRPFIAIDSTRARTEGFLVDKGLGENPSMRQNSIDTQAQRLRIAANSARYWPRLDFNASVRSGDRYRDFPPTFTEKSGTWSLGASVKWPLFVGLDRVKERKALKFELSRLEYQRDQARLDVMQGITSNLAQMMAAAGRGSALLKSSDLARQQIQFATQTYESSHSSYLECLDAAKLYLETVIGGLDARMAFYTSASALVRSIGVSPALENGSPIDVLNDRLNRQLGAPAK